MRNAKDRRGRSNVPKPEGYAVRARFQNRGVAPHVHAREPGTALQVHLAENPGDAVGDDGGDASGVEEDGRGEPSAGE
jgi:hypothetical protein